MLHTAAGLGDLVGGHGGVADEDDLVVVAVLVEQVQGGGALVVATHVVLPHALVDKVVEVEIFQVLELGAGGGEQLLADLDVRVHGAAHVQEQQDFYRVVTLGHHLDIQQPGIAGGGADSVIEVQFFGGAGAGELAQPAQGDLDVAGADLDGIVEILVVAFFPDLDRFLVLAVGTDPDTLRVIALLAEGRGAAGADPLVAALVALFLFLEALLEFLDQLFQATQGFDLRPLFLGEILHELTAQPVVGNQRLDDVIQCL